MAGPGSMVRDRTLVRSGRSFGFESQPYFFFKLLPDENLFSSSVLDFLLPRIQLVVQVFLAVPGDVEVDLGTGAAAQG